MSARIFTYEEVSKHNTRDDLYMIIDKKVYDITKFLDEHPGGDEILIEEGAKDASDAFEDVGHSPDAHDMLKKYHVGKVDPESTPIRIEPPGASYTTNEQKGNPLRIIIPVVFFLGYFYWRFFVHNA
ncbi:cytochrome b5-like heme/steroid binding domain-containing protein [Parasitella parasitica]|nr:cytochrome b5-like heme/steroid binding domain-containing protein [Parasitella parasitica]